MKRYTFTGKLIDYERRNSSQYGNPKFYGIFQNEQGEELEGITATDAMCAYCFLNHMENKRTVTYHVTRTGNCIIDYIDIHKN